MAHTRLILFLMLGCVHAMAVRFSHLLPETVVPVILGTVYLPLWLLKTVGLPVTGPAQSGGWAAPNALGLALIAAIWAAAWWAVVVAFVKLFASILKPKAKRPSA